MAWRTVPKARQLEILSMDIVKYMEASTNLPSVKTRTGAFFLTQIAESKLK
jgi:hypothetical protein